VRYNVADEAGEARMRGGPAIALFVLVASIAASAVAQTPPDPPAICNTWRNQWSDVSAGADAAPMRTFLARVPATCRVLRGQIESHIAQRFSAAQQAARPPAPRPTASAASGPLAESMAAARAAIQRISQSEWRTARPNELVLRVVGASSMDALRALAANGDAGATAIMMGGYVYRVTGFDNNDPETVRWIREASQRGHMWGQFHLARLHNFGIGGVSQDEAAALRLLRLAVAQNYPPAINWLGQYYANGQGGLAVNNAEAQRLMRIAADAGELGAMETLGRWYEDGQAGLAENGQEAARYYRLAADAGSNSALTSLAFMYITDDEDGVAEDRPEGFRLMLRAADGGNPNAQSMVARCYASSSSLGCPLGRSADRAEHYYQLAIAQGYTSAEIEFADAQVRGDGVRQNTSAGLATLRRIASGETTTSGQRYSVDEANFKLGLIYEYGASGAVAENRSLAIQYYSAAARLGNTVAQENLREMGVTSW
jgi:TPR repeat protein